MTNYCTMKTDSLGELLLVADETNLLGVYFNKCGHAPAIGTEWMENSSQSILQHAKQELTEYLAGRRRDFSVNLRCSGTDFQREIWRQIAKIPFGDTITYTELARRAGRPQAIRAAGTATGRNPLSVIVPCHRVVGKPNSSGGYAGGMARKTKLLALERAGAALQVNPL